MLGIHVTNVAVETQRCFMCVCHYWHVNCQLRKVLSIAQQCFHGKFMSPATMQITFQLICSLFTCYILNMLHRNKKKCSFAHGLLCTYNVPKHITLKYKLLHSFSIPVLLYETRPDTINYEAISLKFDECVCLFLPSYPACTGPLFNAAL